jgi:hypothetical protein
VRIVCAAAAQPALIDETSSKSYVVRTTLSTRDEIGPRNTSISTGAGLIEKSRVRNGNGRAVLPAARGVWNPSCGG